jgi:hypothetical protein
MWLTMLNHLAADCSLLPATFQDLSFGIIFTFSSQMEIIKNMNRIIWLKFSTVKKKVKENLFVSLP